MIICDTGSLVAAANIRDPANQRCVAAFVRAFRLGEQLLVPPTVIAETGYLLNRDAGSTVEASFLRSVANGTFRIVELTNSDLLRMADLVEKYADFPLGTTDASVIAVAERLKVNRIATLDVRHFSAVVPNHVPAFDLVP